VVSGKAQAAPRPADRPIARPSKAAHIVLSQRFAAADPAPGKDNGDAEPPLGYRLGATTRMSLDVYNFTDTARTVTLAGRTSGGWTVRPAGPTTVRIPAMGRVGVPFTIAPGGGVVHGRDYPLIFEGRLGGLRIPRSVSNIQLN
jgi:hypothetical protein